MSNAFKGLLFSALIFPGCGQILLAHYVRGVVFFVLAFISGTICVAAMVRQAVLVLQGLAEKGEVISTSKVMAITVDLSTYSPSLILKISLLVLLGLWFSSIIDAWRIGKKLDAKESGREMS